MNQPLKWISELAPFLEKYPSWVKGVFAGWVLMTSVLLLGLVLAKQSASSVSAAPGSGSSGPGSDSSKTPLKKGRETWLKIDGVRFYAAKRGAQIRVNIDVNGTKYTYPDREGIQWLEVGPGMSGQVFRLPPTEQRYVIHFDAKIRIPPRSGEREVIGTLTSVNDDFVDIEKNIPYEGLYILHTFDPVHEARSADAQAEIPYRISFDPNFDRH